MRRVHRVQWSYNLSDPGMEDLLYGEESVRRFVGLRLSGGLPDDSTILNFRHLWKKHGPGENRFEQTSLRLASHGHQLKTGAIVDASVNTGPSSTKKRKGERGPETRETKKGNQGYFGMKVPVGVGADSALARGVQMTPATVPDVVTAHARLHGADEQVWGDAGYQGAGKREENRDAEVHWQVAMNVFIRRGFLGLRGLVGMPSRDKSWITSFDRRLCSFFLE